jgi:hypothetical protein
VCVGVCVCVLGGWGLRHLVENPAPGPGSESVQERSHRWNRFKIKLATFSSVSQMTALQEALSQSSSLGSSFMKFPRGQMVER